jgi:hypothetical protein
MLGVECDPKKSAGSAALFVRSSPVPSNQDIKTYDHGLLNIGVANCPAAYNGFSIGEIWVHYKVKCSKPKLYVMRGLSALSDLYYGSVSLGAVSPTQPFGGNGTTAFLRGQQNNMYTQLTNASGGFYITLPATFTGNFRLILEVTGSGITAMPTITSTTGNVVGIYDQYTTSGAVLNATSTIASANAKYVADYYVTASTGGVNNSLIFTGGAATSITTGYMSIHQYGTNQSSTNLLNLVTSRLLWVNAAGTVMIPN